MDNIKDKMSYGKYSVSKILLDKTHKNTIERPIHITVIKTDLVKIKWP